MSMSNLLRNYWLASDEAGTYTDEVEAYLLEKLKHPKVVALGGDWSGLPLDDST